MFCRREVRGFASCECRCWPVSKQKRFDTNGMSDEAEAGADDDEEDEEEEEEEVVVVAKNKSPNGPLRSRPVLFLKRDSRRACGVVPWAAAVALLRCLLLLKCSTRPSNGLCLPPWLLVFTATI